ncbi:hypothetical protein BA939_23745 [Rhizobium sp. S41]|nr:hypothetical protein BA939_23745 [Rhizobium sp. S41]
MTKPETESNSVMPYQFDGRNIRIVEKAGEYWFVATDVAAELGYREAYDLTRTLDDDEKGPHYLRTLGGEQEVTVISEPGLYRAIVQRRTAKKMDEKLASRISRFQRWVFHDVLPSIRKTGGYNSAPSVTVEGLLANPETLLAITQGYALRIAEMGREMEGMKQEVGVLDRIAKSDGLYGVRQTSQILQMEERKFVAWLMQIGWVFRHTGSKTLMGFAEKRKAGFMQHKLEVYTKGDGSEGSREVLKFTPLGITKLAKRLNITLTDADLGVSENQRAA